MQNPKQNQQQQKAKTNKQTIPPPKLIAPKKLYNCGIGTDFFFK